MANNAQSPAPRAALLMTRPRASSERLVSDLADDALQGVSICYAPLIEIQPLAMSITLDDFAGVIFTSAHAPPLVAPGEGRSAYCVGARTARAAESRGWQVDLVAEQASTLIDLLTQARPKGPLIHLAGVHRRGDIAENLRNAGLSIATLDVYDQPVQPLSSDAQNLLSGNLRTVVPLFSPRTAAQFAHEAEEMRNVVILTMSPAVRDALGDGVPAWVHVCDEPTGKAMRHGVEMLLRQDSLA